MLLLDPIFCLQINMNLIKSEVTYCIIVSGIVQEWTFLPISNLIK